MTTQAPEEREREREYEAGISARMDEIERALKFDPLPEYRRQLVREYLALTEPKKEAAE